MLCLKHRTKDDLYLLHSKIFVKSDGFWLSTTISDPQWAHGHFDSVKLVMKYDGYHGCWDEQSVKVNGEKFHFSDGDHHELVTHLASLIAVRDQQLVKEIKAIVGEDSLKEEEEEKEGKEYFLEKEEKEEKEEEEKEEEEKEEEEKESSFNSTEVYAPTNYQQQELYALVIKHAKIIAELDETSKVTQLAGKIVELKKTVENKSVTITTMEERINKLEEQVAQLQRDIKVVRDKNMALETEKINFKNNLLSQLRDVLNKS